MSGTTNVPSIYVLVRRNNKLLFVSRTNTGYKDGSYTLPAGHVEADESFRIAAARETLEEVGLRVAPADLRHVYTMHRSEHDNGGVRVDVFFEADKWEGEPKNMEPDKHGELAWFPVDHLPFDKIMDYQADVLRAIARGETYAERGWDV